MALTYDLINSQTLNGSSSTVSFTNFGGYTDLILKGNYTSAGDQYLRFNNNAGTYQYLGGTTANNGSQVFISSSSSTTSVPLVGTPNSQQGNINPNSWEVGIPKYTGSNTKNGYVMFSYVTDSSAPRANTGIAAWHWRNTEAITTLTITSTNNITGLISLYGILAGNA